MKKTISINTSIDKVKKYYNRSKKKELIAFRDLVMSIDWRKVSYTKALKILGLSYIGDGTQSAKLKKSFYNGTYTYGVYMTPWDLATQMSGIEGMNNCPGGQHCHDHCLNFSGQNRPDQQARGLYSNINMSRAKKTILYYYNRDLFMFLLIHEIHKSINYANKHNLLHSVRINCTTDHNLLLFKSPKSGKNILKIFGNTQFYDYTKIKSRYKLVEEYENYHLTFSYDGYNWDTCEEILENNGQVAVVFDGPMPATFRGYPVVSGDNYDMRYIDPAGVVIGLTYHKTAMDYASGSYKRPDTAFIVRTKELMTVGK